ncbi:MAG: acyl carrier protein [Chitinophagaceae bacterium]|nr:acyl carrier protein [Chitinophagaceae bacterium]
MEKRISLLMSTVFEIPESEISVNSSIDTIDSWDSIRHLNLILALEEEFGIVIPDEEVGNLVNFKLIELIITENVK